MSRAQQFAGAAVAVWGWAWVGCGGATSSDGRWDSDAAVTLPAQGALPVGPQVPKSPCESGQSAEQIGDYIYASEPAFWLGTQEAVPLLIDGPGFLAARAAEAPYETRFTTELQLFVGPDGTLEDEHGDLVLGYRTTATAGGPCVGPLRAPMFSPPRPTTRMSLSMNLDPRDVVLDFDILTPDESANFSTSFVVFDSLGATHYVDLYVVNRGGGGYGYYVVVDGGDLLGGVPGVNELVGLGELSFNESGWLSRVEGHDVCLDFVNASTQQCLHLDFGGINVSTQVTSFADYTQVFAQSVDGHAAGTGILVYVDPAGDVSAGFDNADSLFIGKLALARFAREAALATDDEGRRLATPRSGEAQLGNPLGPGRGRVRAWPGNENEAALAEAATRASGLGP